MSVGSSSFPQVRVLGVTYTAMTMDDAVTFMQNAVREGRSLTHGDVNAAKMMELRKNPALLDAITACDVVLADGIGIVIASRLLGDGTLQRVPGIDLMTTLIEELGRTGTRFYFLGARDTVVQRVVERVRKTCGDHAIAGCHHGYFAWSESGAIARQIADSKADILFVGMSTPRKELFLHENRAILDRVPVRMSVGGSFDVYGGQIARAPLWVRRCCMEWLFRFLKEPRRLWRRVFLQYPAFLVLVFGAVVKERLSGIRNLRQEEQ